MNILTIFIGTHCDIEIKFQSIFRSDKVRILFFLLLKITNKCEFMRKK